MTTPAAAKEGSRDLDFFLGHRRAKNRQLAKHFEGSTDWSTIEANQGARANHDSKSSP